MQGFWGLGLRGSGFRGFGLRDSGFRADVELKRVCPVGPFKVSYRNVWGSGFGRLLCDSWGC